MLYIKRIVVADMTRQAGLTDETSNVFFNFNENDEERTLTFINKATNVKVYGDIKKKGHAFTITGALSSEIKQCCQLNDIIIIESTSNVYIYKYSYIKSDDSEYNKYDSLLKEYSSRDTHVLLSMDDGKLSFDPQITETSKNLLTALRTKPFVLLAGISGTGKSRIVRELAKACWKENDDEFGKNCPRNFCMVQVKPNWHDSSELMGYVSRIGEKPVFVTGDFLKFVARAWQEPEKPYFLCLDEMNLAPVEQYFAEYLSVIESRKLNTDGTITTDPILKKEVEEWYHTLICSLTGKEELRVQFLNNGIAIPQNLFVIGTVNMDETTFSFSRKVLDRAMTIEMNEVDLHGGLESGAPSEFGYIGDVLKCVAVEGKDVYDSNKGLCDKVIEYLEKINTELENTPFKIAYRTRNEFLVYAVSRGEENLANSLDEMTSMKILSRIEGDADKIGNLLDRLETVIKQSLNPRNEELTLFDESTGAAGQAEKSISLEKLKEMKARMTSGYVSFWS